MSATKRAKELGVSSITEVADYINKSPVTLYAWYKKNPALFDVVMMGYAMSGGDASIHAYKDGDSLVVSIPSKMIKESV